MASGAHRWTAEFDASQSERDIIMTATQGCSKQ